jgi:hypothetical protein
MRTVKSLREELAKFDDDAVCHAYEGEVIGIVVNPPGPVNGPRDQGVIYCGEGDDDEQETEVPDSLAAQPMKKSAPNRS